MFYVISYDVPDDRRRLKIAKALEQVGTRVQYSVFEAYLEDKDLTQLRQRLKRVLDPKTDGLRMYRLCGECRRTVETIGRGGVLPEPALVIV